MLPYEPEHVQAAAAGARKRKKQPPPDFGDLLIRDFAAGRTSAVRTQTTASSALAWCEGAGGKIIEGDFVSRVASLGTNGTHPANTERDFHRLIRSCCKRLGAPIEHVNARMFNHKAGTIEWRQVAVLFPDTLATALYRLSEDVFRKCLFGNADAASYWDHTEQHAPWFQRHPMRSYPKRSHMVPFSLYGDDVTCYRNSEVGTVSVVGWSSDFSYGNSSTCRYFPICVFSENDAVEFTHDDIMTAVVPRLNRMFDPRELHEWSDKGYVFMMSSIQGDLKWLNLVYGLHDYRANSFCSWCGCLKAHEDVRMTLGDFRENALHLGSEPDLTAMERKASPVFSLEGSCVERVLHDTCHSQFLGTGKLLNGSVLVYLCERSFFGDFGRQGKYDENLERVLRAAHLNFLTWKKQHRLQCSQPRFTPARLSRRNRTDFPILQSKAIASKTISFWLNSCAVQLSCSNSVTETDQIVSTTLHAYCSFVQSMDVCGIELSESEAQGMYDNVMTHLRTYAYLNRTSRAVQGKHPGRCMWLLAPKHHHMQHLARTVLTEKVNPAFYTLLCAEDFVGKMGRIARMCHRTTVSERCLQRYLAVLFLALQDLKP